MFNIKKMRFLKILYFLPFLLILGDLEILRIFYLKEIKYNHFCFYYFRSGNGPTLKIN